MPAFLAASWVADPYLGPVSLGLGKAARKKQGGGVKVGFGNGIWVNHGDFDLFFKARGKLRGLDALTDTQQSVSTPSKWSTPILKELASFKLPLLLS